MPAPADDTRFEHATSSFLTGLASQGADYFAAAEQHYLASLRLVSGRPATLINLAATLLRLARPAEALVYAENAVRNQPGSADALMHRATAVGQLGRLHNVLAAFQRLAAIDPGLATA